MEKKNDERRIEVREAPDAYLWETNVDRRTFLKMLEATGMLALTSGSFLLRPNMADAASYEEEDKIRRQIPRPDEPVPEIEIVTVPESYPWHSGLVRKWASDGEKIGLKYKIRPTTEPQWADIVSRHTYGGVELHDCVMRPERVDPSEWLVSRAHSVEAPVGRRNYGEYQCKEYDYWVDKQLQEFDSKKRLEYVWNAQQVLAEDYYICVYGWGPSVISVYNAEDWEGYVPTTGFGIGTFDLPNTYYDVTPKTGRKRFIAGAAELVRTTNIISDPGSFRGLGRMIYDRYVFLDKDLNVIPWAAEGWKQIDAKTFDIKLRGGMKFHDGKSVTVDDVKFTFDYVLKYKPIMMAQWVQIVDKVEIQDRDNRIVRFYMKKPYGQFLTFLMLIAFILPKHLWENITQEQGVESPDKVMVDRPIGSGPFKFVHYTKDVEILLAANKEHFHAPKIDELLVRPIPSVDALMAAIEHKEIDTIGGLFNLSPTMAKRLSTFPHLKVVTIKDTMWMHAVTFISRMPWRDIEFRKAWHYSIDKRFVVDVLWEGGGRVATMNTFLVPNNPWHNPNLPKPPYGDLKLAYETLMKAGYTIKGGRLIYPPPTDKAFIGRIKQVLTDGHTWIGQPLIEG